MHKVIKSKFSQRYMMNMHIKLRSKRCVNTHQVTSKILHLCDPNKLLRGQRCPIKSGNPGAIAKKFRKAKSPVKLK